MKPLLITTRSTREADRRRAGGYDIRLGYHDTLADYLCNSANAHYVLINATEIPLTLAAQYEAAGFTWIDRHS